MIGKCKLCGNKNKLKASHIIPKFIYKWMKETGSGYIRMAEAPNLRRQDGPTKYLLCQACEKRFSQSETYFFKTIFYPYLNESRRKFNYDNKLIYFLISVLWRILTNELDECKKEKHAFLSKLCLAENEWRKFLLAQNNNSKFLEIHLFMTDLLAGQKQPVANLNQYLTRTVDGTVVSNRRCCAIYAKLSRFIIFGFLTPYDESKWINTKIVNGNGVLVLPQALCDGAITEFLVERARIAFEPLGNISKRQQKVINEHFIKNATMILQSDFGKILDADYTAEIDPGLIWKKIGRNEKCPCGSGKKYKYCHGK
jgi:hypothetical protein